LWSKNYCLYFLSEKTPPKKQKQKNKKQATRAQYFTELNVQTLNLLTKLANLYLQKLTVHNSLEK